MRFCCTEAFVRGQTRSILARFLARILPRVLSRVLAILLVGVVSACDVPAPPASARSGTASGPVLSPAQAARNFTQVVRAVEPIAEQECRRRTSNVNCDFQIVVDKNPKSAPNAYQSLDKSGRPVITFTVAMIGSVHNADELASILGHETAHHISGHLAQQANNAAAGAVIFAGLAALTGASAADVAAAQEIGAAVGARSYSKDFELEADRLGTIITIRAGYDPLIGVKYFTRIADPGDRFLGSHPPNTERINVVRSTSKQMGLG